MLLQMQAKYLVRRVYKMVTDIITNIIIIGGTLEIWHKKVA